MPAPRVWPTGAPCRAAALALAAAGDSAPAESRAGAGPGAVAQRREREFRLLKGIAEGTYNTKHAEAARLYYTTILRYYHIHTHTPT